MANEGIWLEIVLIIVIIIAAVIILAGFITPFLTSMGALNFGFKCYSAFTGFNVMNNYLFPLSTLASSFVGTPSLSPVTGMQVEAACIQQSNINAYDTASIATQIYGKASECFSLFSTSNGKATQQLLSSKGINQVFTCFNGKIISSSTNSTITNFSSVISYIDKYYYDKASPLEMVFITNNSQGSATLPNLSPSSNDINITNDSMYSIAYFGFPPSGVPSSCEVDYSIRSEYLNSPAYEQQAQTHYEPVNVLSDWLQNTGSAPADSVCADNYTVNFCGKLLNFMIMNQQIVFVCITTK